MKFLLPSALLSSLLFASVTQGQECQTIAEIACTNPDFQAFCNIVQASPELAEILSDTTNTLTVFAPNNDAVGKLPPATIEMLLKSENMDALKDILYFHAVEGAKIMSTDLACSELVKMANGKDSRTVCVGGKIHQKGAGNERDPTEMMPEIVQADIEACNGIVHVVNQVMLP